VPENAEIVLNYYQTFDVLGRATLQPPPGFQGELDQFPIEKPHVLIDRTPIIHTEIMTRIKAMLASMTPPVVPRAGPKPARRNVDAHHTGGSQVDD